MLGEAICILVSPGRNDISTCQQKPLSKNTFLIIKGLFPLPQKPEAGVMSPFQNKAR